jgi:PhnB protein
MKPTGYSTVSPYLIVAGAQRVVDFLRRTFDGQELRRFERPDGAIMHTEVRIGDTVVMLADAGEGWPPVPAHLHVYVEDVDATYRRALHAGAEPVSRRSARRTIPAGATGSGTAPATAGGSRPESGDGGQPVQTCLSLSNWSFTSPLGETIIRKTSTTTMLGIGP